MSVFKNTVAAVAAFAGLGAATNDKAEACRGDAGVPALGLDHAKEIEKKLEGETGVNHDIVELPPYNGPAMRCGPRPTHEVVPAPAEELRPHVKGKDLSKGPVLDGWGATVERGE